MIASNIICRGASRFLNTAYFQDVSIAGTASLASLSLSGNLSVGGNATVSGTLGVTGEATFSNVAVFSKVGQSTATWNNPALVVGGTADQKHLELCNDTIQGKNNKNTTNNLYLNYYGSNVYLAGSKIYAIRDSTFVAPTANIVTVNAQNVNVTNNLRANHYDLQTVAQLGGSFYVSPTVKFPNSGTTLKVEKSGSTLTLTITDSSITSTTMAGVVWSANSRVKVSGTINGVVTGTMDGTVSSINTSSHVLTLSVSGENSANVVAGTYTASQFSDLTVMIYYRRSGSNNYRVGIWMNCYDHINSSSTIRVYGGTATNPTVTIGNLTGMTFNGNQIEGTNNWGILTSMGYFEGAVISNEGQIGGFTIGDTTLKNGDLGGTTSVVMSTGTASSTAIGGSSGSKTWAFTASNKFGVTTSGELFATSGKIGGWTIGTSSLYNTTNSMTSTGVGLYLGTDGIRNYASGTQYVNITSGKITALGVDVSGKITATSGAIGGFDITSTAIKTKDVAVTSNADNSISLSSADFTRTINSTSRAGLRFAIGDKFGVTGDGAIYASSATISGAITATSLTLGTGVTIAQSQVNGLTTALNGKASTSSVTDAAKTATNFITADGTNGIKIHKTSNTTDYSQITNDYVQIISDGTHIYKGSNDVAFFGDTARIGRIANGIVRTQIDSDSFDVIKRASNTDTVLATFGETATIGNMSARGVSIDANGFKFNNSGEQNFFIGVNNRSGDTITSATATVTKSSTTKTIDDIVYYRVASIASGQTVISVVGYFVSATENGEELMFAAVENNVESWVVDSGYLWVEDGYSTYSSFEESITYAYVASNTSNLPYMVLGISAYDNNNIPGVISFAQGYKNKATGSFSTALGSSTVASGVGSFACGTNTESLGDASFACGIGTIASGEESFACGRDTVASGKYSYANGWKTTASARYSHAEGWNTTATGEGSHTEGDLTTATGIIAHAEGFQTKASGSASHAEGYHTTALSQYSHAEGSRTRASGEVSHAEGSNTVAAGFASHTSGQYTVAQSNYNTVIGKYNKATVSTSGSGSNISYTYTNVGDYPFIIGNGTANTTAARSNAFTVDWSGNVWAAGKVMAKNTSHVGMIIMSTTLDTMAKVIAVYGGTTWIRHSGYFLYGASSGVTANHAAKDGGESTHTLTVNEMPSHRHKVSSGWQDSTGTDRIVYSAKNGDYYDYGLNSVHFIENTGGGAAHNNMPPYKNIYIWERTK